MSALTATIEPQQGEDCRAAVRDCDIANVVNHHFIESGGSKGGFDHIGDGLGGENILIADILASYLLTSED